MRDALVIYAPSRKGRFPIGVALFGGGGVTTMWRDGLDHDLQLAASFVGLYLKHLRGPWDVNVVLNTISQTPARLEAEHYIVSRDEEIEDLRTRVRSDLPPTA